MNNETLEKMRKMKFYGMLRAFKNELGGRENRAVYR
jgi:hypothetical protein